MEISLAEGRPLTLADLRRFLERCGEFGIPDSCELRATVSMGGKLKKITVKETKPRGRLRSLDRTPGLPDGYVAGSAEQPPI